jgi:tyrosyl-tRNA synthetase
VNKGLPDEIPLADIAEGEYGFAALLAKLGLVTSNSEGRRAIEGNSVAINQEKQGDPNLKFVVKKSKDETLINVGKKKWVKIHATLKQVESVKK